MNLSFIGHLSSLHFCEPCESLLIDFCFYCRALSPILLHMLLLIKNSHGIGLGMDFWSNFFIELFRVCFIMCMMQKIRNIWCYFAWSKLENFICRIRMFVIKFLNSWNSLDNLQFFKLYPMWLMQLKNFNCEIFLNTQNIFQTFIFHIADWFRAKIYALFFLLRDVVRRNAFIKFAKFSVLLWALPKKLLYQKLMIILTFWSLPNEIQIHFSSIFFMHDLNFHLN